MVCDNCISIRAYRNRHTYIKIEYKEDRTYLITAIPITVQGKTIVVELLKDTTDSMFLNNSGEKNTDEIHSLINRMNEMNVKDALTGIYNRRYIDEKLPIDLLNCGMNAEHISVIMADIDWFKRVNDTYGHQTGDCVLRQFAQILSECLHRGSDWVARYGGEEFLICLPNADRDIAAEIAQQMRSRIEQEALRCGDEQIHVTSSFGICSIRADFTESAEDMIRQAIENCTKRSRTEETGLRIDQNDRSGRLKSFRFFFYAVNLICPLFKPMLNTAFPKKY
jgi:diguanylate cyclase (GGDEF)-like protein